MTPSFQTIALIGGTGRTGNYVIQQLIRDGFRVRMLSRDPKSVKIPSPQVEIVPGDVLDEASVKRLLEGCNAVISTLGLREGGAMNTFSTSTEHVLRAMCASDIRRYIVITGLNVDAPTDVKSPKTRFATDWMHQNYPKTTADKQLEFELLSESGLDWTLVRLPMIRVADELLPLKISLEDCPGDEVTTASLAVFLVDELSETAFIGQAPFVATR
jgi:putative NADH-flavin reductase